MRDSKRCPIFIFRLVQLTFIYQQTVLARLCRNNEHVVGEWKLKLIEETREKTFFCCDYDSAADANLYPDKCGKEYEYGHKLVTYSGNNQHYSPAGSHACQCDDPLQGGANLKFNVTNREMYRWVPRHCDLLAWNSTQFCHLLGSRKILFVGDSTMQQTFATLVSMIMHSGGGCAEQIIMGRSDHVAFTLKSRLSALAYVMKYQPDICIIAFGSHQSDEGDILDIWGKISLQLESFRTASHKNITLVFKSQNPGHVNCTSAKEPIPTRQVIIPHEENDLFNYYNQRIFDNMSKNISTTLGFKLIDMEPLHYRPDAHPYKKLLPHKRAAHDCLHYCMPGPLDVFSHILLNMLHTGELG